MTVMVIVMVMMMMMMMMMMIGGSKAATSVVFNGYLQSGDGVLKPIRIKGLINLEEHQPD